MIARLPIMGMTMIAGFLASGAMATTPVPPPPHHPEFAGCKIKALVSAIDRGDRTVLSNGLRIYSDKLGAVSSDELDQFFTEFLPRDSKKNASSLRLTHWGVLDVAETLPLYVITMAREPIDSGHWSAWLVQFKSDEIVSLRRADELWPFASEGHFFGYKDCPDG